MFSHQMKLVLVVLSLFIVVGCGKPANPDVEANAKLTPEAYDKKVQDEESKNR